VDTIQPLAVNAVTLRNVAKTFGTRAAVADLSLEVPRGSIYGFIGPNGSGKTTTLRMIVSILLPDCGEIEVLGERGGAAVRDRVAYLPEERGLYKKMTVRRLLRYYGRLKGCRPPELDRRVEAWLKRLDLSAWTDKKIESLSKGMAQKVQFIAAVISEPEVLILDEPFTGLDPVNLEVLKEAIIETHRRGTTVIFSTHDMGTAEKLCDRIFMIFEGKKVLDGTLEEIQAAHAFPAVRVETSAGTEALEAMPEVESVSNHGRLREVRLRGDPQEFLRRLVLGSQVQRFEIARPSLHDIFVRIARPPKHASDE
jgi:ABC-2 type transport system ATP-binding protein